MNKKLLIALVLIVMSVLMLTPAAVFAKAEIAKPESSLLSFDPFVLDTVVVTAVVSAPQAPKVEAQSSDPVAMLSPSTSRPSIRVPYRPALRSAYRPPFGP